MAFHLRKYLFLILGILLVFIGVAGVLLPVLPGTPFLLGGLVFIIKGSRRMHVFLHRHPLWGPRIRAFRKQPGLSRNEKVAMGFFSSLSAFFSYYFLGLSLSFYLISSVVVLFWILLLFIIPTSNWRDLEDSD